jgi:hypothetical protein
MKVKNTPRKLNTYPGVKINKRTRTYQMLTIRLRTEDFDKYAKICAKNKWLLSEKPKELIKQIINNTL